MATITKRTNKSGHISYRIKVSLGYDLHGKQITKSMTYKPPMGMSARKMESEANKQAIIFEERLKSFEIVPQRIKFKEAAERWLAYETERNRLKAGTLEFYKSMQDRIYNGLGHIYIDKITKPLIQSFIFDLANGKDGKKPLSEKTQKNYIAFISRTFKFSVDYLKAIPFSPCDSIQPKSTGHKKREYYTIDEELELLSRMYQRNTPLQYITFYMFAMYLGLRNGEILGLEWSDIDLSEKTVYIHQNAQYRNQNTGSYVTSTKNDSSERCLILPEELIDVLQQLKDKQNLDKQKAGDKWVNSNRVICGKFGVPMFVRRPYNYLKAFCERESLSFKTIHGFRHSVVTNALHNGVDLATVSSMVGHSNPNTTLRVYTHEVKQATAVGCSTIASLLRRNKDQNKEFQNLK